MSVKQGVLNPGVNPIARKTKEKSSRGKHLSDYYNQINVNHSEIEAGSRLVRDRVDMNGELMSLLPELRQLESIIVSSMISPNDFAKTELIVDMDNYLELPESLVQKARELHKLGLERYDIEDTLFEVGQNALFRQGADIELIIPRSKVEKLISDSVEKNVRAGGNGFDLESISPSDIMIDTLGGITINSTKEVELDDKVKAKLEDFNIKSSNDPLLLTVNSEYGKLVRDNDRNTLFKNNNLMGLDMESIDNNVLSIYDRFKRDVKKPVLVINNDKVETKNIKRDVPFRMKLKSSAVMPIFTESPDKHIMYIIPVDEMNRAIIDEPSDYDMIQYLDSGNNISSNLKMILDKASEGMDNNKDKSKKLSNMLDISEMILLSGISDSLSNSVYRNARIADRESSLVRIMLYRALKNMETKLVFVPADYISYIAFDYRKNGTGKSLLEDITILASFKAMLSLSEIYAAVQNNIPVTDIAVEIDPDDPEPMKTKEMIEENLYSNPKKNMPWGQTSLERHGLWLQNAGLRVHYAHKTFPNTTIEIETKNRESNYDIDTSTADRVMTMIIKTLGLSPSILEDADSPEFASVAMISNSLSNKINTSRQDILSKCITDRHFKLLLSDGVMLQGFYDLAEANKTAILSAINDTIEDESAKLKTLSPEILSEVAKDLIYMGVLTLPRAENKDVETLNDKFDSYVNNIDKMMDSFTKTLKLDSLPEELGLSTDVVAHNIRLHLILNWCEKHNYAPEMVKFFSASDRKSLKDMIDRIVNKDKNVIELLEATFKSKIKSLDKITKFKEKEESRGSEEDLETDPIDEPDTGNSDEVDTRTDDDDGTKPSIDNIEEPEDLEESEELESDTNKEESGEDDMFSEPEDK